MHDTITFYNHKNQPPIKINPLLKQLENHAYKDKNSKNTLVRKEESLRELYTF